MYLQSLLFTLLLTLADLVNDPSTHIKVVIVGFLLLIDEVIKLAFTKQFFECLNSHQETDIGSNLH